MLAPPLHASAGDHGLAIARHNPCLLRHQQGFRTLWRGQVPEQDLSPYLAFLAPEHGLRAAARVLLSAQRWRRLGTAGEVLAWWFRQHGSGDRVEQVLNLLGRPARRDIDVAEPETMAALLRAIARLECGGFRYDPALLTEAIVMAGLPMPRAIPAEGVR